MEHHRERQATVAVIDPRFSHAKSSHDQLSYAQPFPQLPPVLSALTPAVVMRSAIEENTSDVFSK